MARDILGEFGPERSIGSGERSGGVKDAKEIANYKPPQGPINQHREGPGLGGDNHGVCGTQGKH